MNDLQMNICKGTFKETFKVLFQNSSEKSEKNSKKPQLVLAKIPTGQVPNTSLERYSYMKLLS
jgi:hypothetical protein